MYWFLYNMVMFSINIRNICIVGFFNKYIMIVQFLINVLIVMIFVLQKREGLDDMGVIVIVEIDIDRDRDAQVIFEKFQEINKVILFYIVYDVFYLVFWGLF